MGCGHGAWLRSKAVRKMSMGYEDKHSDYTSLKQYGKTRNLREVALGEGSLVISPMNPTADVNLASVKSLLDAARAGRERNRPRVHR